MLGAIADDFTGATDLATMLRRSGHRTIVLIEDGAPHPAVLASTDAIVIAQKTRTAPREAAVTAARRACIRLLGWGADRIYVKYCSTFDSTDEGNIGPILDALSDDLGSTRCVVVPSLPANARTVYKGHLFVGDDLLENSSMRTHPLTPMTRSRVADLLRPQTRYAVSEIHLETVREGSGSLAHILGEESARYLVIDAIDDGDLDVIADATVGDRLVSGGSGLALGMRGPGLEEQPWEYATAARRAVLCGSASTATRGQIAHAGRTQPVRGIDLRSALSDAEGTSDALARWVLDHDTDAIPVICTARGLSDSPAALDVDGGIDGAAVIEQVLAGVAHRLVSSGECNSIIVAGGESSGAVVRELGVRLLRIGPELAPGVCWSLAETKSAPVALALKSGNFGAEDLFTAAWDTLG